MVIYKGLIQDVIDRALLKQFNNYLVSQGMDPDNITEETRETLKESYSQSLYPGSQTPPDSMVKVLIADDPSSSIEASALTNPEFFDSISQTTKSSAEVTTTTTSSLTSTPTTCGCVAPFWEPLETKALLGVTDSPCVANFGMKYGWSKKCLNNGGYGIHFTGFDSIFLQTLLTQGMLYFHYCLFDTVHELMQLKYLDVPIFFEKVNGNILEVYHFGMMHFCLMEAPLLGMLFQIAVKILA
jgi:hypothetical protein